MPSRVERREDVGMSVGQSEPSKMLCHTVVLVLSSTVVSMHVHSPLPKAVIVKEVVDATYHTLGTFATVPCIPMHNFTGYTTHCAGLRCMKVDRTRFQCFGWIILLHVARGIVYFDVTELQSRWHTDLVSDHCEKGKGRALILCMLTSCSQRTGGRLQGAWPVGGEGKDGQHASQSRCS